MVHTDACLTIILHVLADVTMSPNKTEIVVQPGDPAIVSFLVCYESDQDYIIQSKQTLDNSDPSVLRPTNQLLSHQNTTVNGYFTSLFDLPSPSVDIICKEVATRLLNKPCLHYRTLTIELELVLFINETSKLINAGHFNITMAEHNSLTENCIEPEGKVYCCMHM